MHNKYVTKVTCCVSVCLCVTLHRQLKLLRVSSVLCENLHSAVLLKAPHACKKFCELLIFHRDFREKNMYFTRFCLHFSNVHFSWKNHHFLFVTLSQMIRFSSNLCNRRKIQLSYWIYTLKRPIIPFPRISFLKTWNFHCTRTSKNWKINNFFWLFSFVLVLFSDSRLMRRTRFCRF